MTSDTSTVTAIPVGKPETQVRPEAGNLPPPLVPDEGYVDPGASTFADDDDDDFLLDEPAKEEQAFVQLYEPKCLNCKKLVPFATKSYKGCHFSNGNEHCPAASLKIVVRIPLEKIISNFLSAERNGDNQRLAQLYAKLGEKEDWYQARVNEALAKARKEKQTSE